MVKVKVKNGDITQFLHAWDREAYDLNLELKKIRNRKDLNLKYGKNLIIMMKVVVNLEFYTMDWCLKKLE